MHDLEEMKLIINKRFVSWVNDKGDEPEEYSPEQFYYLYISNVNSLRGIKFQFARAEQEMDVYIYFTFYYKNYESQLIYCISNDPIIMEEDEIITCTVFKDIYAEYSNNEFRYYDIKSMREIDIDIKMQNEIEARLCMLAMNG